MTSKAVYSDKSKISFMIIFSIWTVRGKKTYSLNFLLRNLIVLILAGNLQLLYFIYKTLHSQGKTFCEDYWKKKICSIWLGPPHSLLCSCQSLSQGWHLFWHSQWGWFNLRSLSGATAWFPIYEKFPLRSPDAWISTCQSKGANLTPSFVVRPSLLIPGSCNSHQHVSPSFSISISPHPIFSLPSLSLSPTQLHVS